MGNRDVFYPGPTSSSVPLWAGDFTSFNPDGYVISYAAVPGGLSSPVKGVYAVLL